MTLNSVSSKIENKKITLSLLRSISLNISNYRDQAILRLFIETGCSVKDLINLRTNSFEFTTCSLSLPSGKLKIPLDLSLLLNKIKDLKKPYLFYTKSSLQLNNIRVLQIINHWTKLLLGKKFSPNQLRKIYFDQSGSNVSKSTTTKPVREYLDIKQIDLFKSNINNVQHQLMFDIILETGCTLSELVNLKVSDIKTDSRLSKNLSLQLNDYSKDMSQDSYLFYTRQSPKYSDKRVFQIIKKYAKLAGISKVNYRILKNTSVALLRQKGMDDDQISTHVGISHLEQYHFGVLAKIK